jgi:hypothetical protein
VLEFYDQQMPSVFEIAWLNLLKVRLILIYGSHDWRILRCECPFLNIDNNLKIKANLVLQKVTTLGLALLNAKQDKSHLLLLEQASFLRDLFMGNPEQKAHLWLSTQVEII